MHKCAFGQQHHPKSRLHGYVGRGMRAQPLPNLLSRLLSCSRLKINPTSNPVVFVSLSCYVCLPITYPKDFQGGHFYRNRVGTSCG